MRGENLAKKKLPDLAAYQHRSAPVSGAAGSGEGKSAGPAAKPFSSGDKDRDKAQTAAIALELDGLQEMLYADRRFKLLVVLQGTDTSGKDGTIRGVFGQMSALGVHTVGWKAPNDD